MDASKHYHHSPDPFKIDPGTIIDEKMLSDGSKLLLGRGVSALEFIGTQTYDLKIYTSYGENQGGESYWFLAGHGGAMLSEAAYRIIMGGLNQLKIFGVLKVDLRSK